MSRNKEVRRIAKEFCNNGAVVFSRITSNVLHQHLSLLTPKAQHFRKSTTQVGTIDIAVHCPQWFQRRQLFGKFRCTDIPNMPNLVAFSYVLGITVVPIRMGI